MRRAGLVAAWVTIVACSGRGAPDARRQRWDAQRRGLGYDLEQQAKISGALQPGFRILAREQGEQFLAHALGRDA